MDEQCRIRELHQNETELLKTFLYEAIFIPDGVKPPPKDIVEQPELRVYTDDFASRPGDIGTMLMREMLALLKSQGYRKASLVVQKANYAVKLYDKVGFRVVGENSEEYIMLCEL